MNLLIDCLGGDKAPNDIIKGVCSSLKSLEDVHFILVGKESIVKDLIKKFKGDINKCEVINAEYEITPEDNTISVIKDKKDSSLGTCFSLLKDRNDIDGFLTAATTGACLTGSIFKVGRIDNLYRPCLMATIPSRTGQLVRIADVGANMDCKPEYLYQFALMGNQYLKLIGFSNPRIGLLSVGMEDEKGNQLTHDTFNLLKSNKNLNFIGNIEGDHVLKGEADFVVADGFAGNVFIKSLEECAYFVSDNFQKAIFGNPISAIGSIFQLPGLLKVKNLFKFANRACAPLLGIKKLVIKMHGKSDYKNVESCIKQAVELIKLDFATKITNSLEECIEEIDK